MHIPRYWARGTAKAGRLFTKATGWSDRSVIEACDAARAKAERVLLALAAGNQLDRYAYGERDALREEIIEQHGKSGDKGEVIITRNRYGSLVLNTPNVMFVDVDDPKPKKKGFFASLFGKREIMADCMELRRHVEGSIMRHDDLHCAIYRTKAGFRVLVLNKLYDPASDETKTLLQSLGSDPLYTCLTQNQKCFRARLSPKPWRCKMAMPPCEYPRETEKPELAFMRWVAAYNKTIAGYATCEFAGEIGTGAEAPEAAFVRKLHDAYCISAGKPLA
jgi:hypothetical protein